MLPDDSHFVEICIFPSTRANTPKDAMTSREVVQMAGRRSERMANVTATLPILLLEKIDELIAEGKISSRSHVIREAVKNYLKTSE